MADCRFARLGHRGVLSVAGPDRNSFLQGLVTNDMVKVGPDRAIWAAFLTPQGKFLHDLFIAEVGEAYLIDVEAARLDDLKKRLTIYKLRSKVDIQASALAVYAVWGTGTAAALGLADETGAAEPLANGTAFIDPRLKRAGARVMIPTEKGDAVLAGMGIGEGALSDWDQSRIALGLPDGSRDLGIDKAILLENGFDELSGVDFAKGCYLGQELTSRTKYRGLVRKRLMPVAIEGVAPEPGTKIMFGDAEAGEMHSSAGAVGLAMIRLEYFRKAAASGEVFRAGDAKLKPSKPDWAVFPEED